VTWAVPIKLFEAYSRLVAIGTIAAFACGCTGRSDKTTMDLLVYDPESKKDRALRLTEGMSGARFCGCPPCVQAAKGMDLGEQSAVHIVTFTGPVEMMVDFKREADWKTPIYIEKDSRWAQVWGPEECPRMAVFRADSDSFK
jgi:hypothetical protein